MFANLCLDDLPEVRSLFLQVFTQEPWNDRWESEAYVDLYLNELIGNPNSLSFGYYHDRQLIGLSLGSIYHWWQGKEYFIKEFCIAKSFQGQGMGKRFFAMIEEALLTQNIHAIWLSTERDVPAYEFYHALGFKEQANSVLLAKRIWNERK
jgi:aminoglycoside 6'-N-acetyltransferase I